MGSAGVYSGANYLSGFKLHQQLGFQRMAFLLAAVVALLFFWGRSISISPTSTTMTFHSQPG